MKTLTLLLFLCFTSIIGFTQTKTFDIEFIQFGKIVPYSTKNTIDLHRAPFTIKVKMKGIEEIYCQASFSDSLFVKKSNEQIADFKSIPAMSMAEKNFNADSSLVMRTESWHCWFYDSKLDWNRFDANSIKVKGNTITALKTINKFFEIDDTDIQNPKTSQSSIIEENPTLYLFFLSASKTDNDFYLGKELDRLPLKVNWLK